MELLARLQDDMKAAMKSGQKERLGVIRMLISEVKNIDLQPTKPSPQQAVEGYAKRLRKSAEELAKLGRNDDVAILQKEIAITEEYLPTKLGPAETETLVDVFLTQHSFTEKQIGQATGMFMKQHGSTVDPSLVNPLLRSKLAGK
ncbi:MAG TPA: GatB/YqeY domain-containing protein [Tepidisphaeraceae bacterium]|jgi:hypothetical protein